MNKMKWNQISIYANITIVTFIRWTFSDGYGDKYILEKSGELCI